jgi:flagellum-specific peptidoglycan hydrolase FlgJ
MAKKAISLILVALLIGVTTTFASNQKPLPVKRDKHAFINTLFSPNLLMQALIDAGIQHPEIVYAQALIESGNFTSWLFQHNHNLFGMKLAVYRKTTAIGERRNHARFSDWFEAVKDYKLWQDAKFGGKLVSQSEYLKALSKYAADKRYISKVRKHLPESESLLREGA